MGLAAERYRRDHNAWPLTAQELVPGYIEAVPRDPFVDAPLAYTILADGVEVSSTGDDSEEVPLRFFENPPGVRFRLWDPASRLRLRGEDPPREAVP